jgi:8-oxo-dGTP pyrophosphatase MutT (NUDIX family)
MRSLTFTDGNGQTTVTKDVEFFNTLVMSCPRYIQLNRYTYGRVSDIRREHYSKVNNWPLHPVNEHKHILGAIILIISKDLRILLVRNGKLWGLPKGARNYRPFLQMKQLTDQVYVESNHILLHGDITICPEDAETAVENVCRETLEETGLKIDTSKLRNMGVPDPGHSGYCWFYYEYEGVSDEYWLQTLSGASVDHENDELMWVAREELDSMLKKHASSKVFNHISYLFLISLESQTSVISPYLREVA